MTHYSNYNHGYLGRGAAHLPHEGRLLGRGGGVGEVAALGESVHHAAHVLLHPGQYCAVLHCTEDWVRVSWPLLTDAKLSPQEEARRLSLLRFQLPPVSGSS